MMLYDCCALMIAVGSEDYYDRCLENLCNKLKFMMMPE